MALGISSSSARRGPKLRLSCRSRRSGQVEAFVGSRHISHPDKNAGRGPCHRATFRRNKRWERHAGSRDASPPAAACRECAQFGVRSRTYADVVVGVPPQHGRGRLVLVPGRSAVRSCPARKFPVRDVSATPLEQVIVHHVTHQREFRCFSGQNW